MTTPESGVAAGNPRLGAEEIGKRFLNLIEGLKSRNDINPARIRDAMGIPLVPPRSKEEMYGYSGPLEGGWHYGLVYVPESGSLKNGVFLEFSNPDEPHADMTSVCGLDFDDYHNALKAMGFIAHPMYGEIGQLQSWRYTKYSKVNGAAEIEISIIPQNIGPGGAGRLCVRSVSTLN